MQGNNTQDWKDDAAFWDEAWADMEQRLDNDRSRWGFAIWVRRMFPLLLLLGGGVIAGFLLTRTGSEEPTAPHLPPAAVVSQPAKPIPPVDVNSADAGELKTISPTSLQAPAPNTHLSGSMLPETDSDQIIYAANASLEKQGGDYLSESQELNPVETPTILPLDNEIPAEAPSALTSLPSPPPQATDLLTPPSYELDYAIALPKNVLKKQKTPLAFGIETGASLASGRDRPGYFAGIYTEFAPGKRFSFPIAIRFRQDRLKVRISDSEEVASDVALGAGGDISNFSLEGLSLNGRNLDFLKLNGLELSAGISARVTPRLRAHLDLGGSYLLAVRGLTGLTVENGVYNFDYQNIPDNRQVNEFNGTPTGSENLPIVNNSVGNLSRNAGVNRFQLRTQLGLSYKLSPSLSLLGAASRFQTSVINDELLRVRPMQYSLGMRYRLR